jgi:uncharacterized alkaline shock family protein YloU
MALRAMPGVDVNLVLSGAAGMITVPDGVLLQIASTAAESVDGVRVRRRRTIDLDARVVKLAVAARRGQALASLGVRVQEQVAGSLKGMCGLDLTVDVAIEELT